MTGFRTLAGQLATVFILSLLPLAGAVSYAVSGIGSQTHLAGELLQTMTGIKMTPVPYKGTAPATAPIMSGEVQAGIFDLATLLPLSEKLMILAVVDAERSMTVPNIATVAESSVPGYAASGWVMMLVRAGTPREIVSRLNAAATGALSSPEIRQALLKVGIEPAPGSANQAHQFLRAEIEKWGQVIGPPIAS